MEGPSNITKVLHEQDIGYTFVGYRSSSIPSLESAERAVANIALSQDDIDKLLSVAGLSRATSEPVSYRRYILEAYLDGSVVDRIGFVCRYA